MGYIPFPCTEKFYFIRRTISLGGLDVAYYDKMEITRPKISSARRFRAKVPTSQRKRIERACTRCRMRKRKCRFAQSDVCLNCRRDGHSCVLELASTKETVGLPPWSVYHNFSNLLLVSLADTDGLEPVLSYWIQP